MRVLNCAWRSVVKYPLILGTGLDKMTSRVVELFEAFGPQPGAVVAHHVCWFDILTYMRRSAASHARWLGRIAHTQQQLADGQEVRERQARLQLGLGMRWTQAGPKRQALDIGVPPGSCTSPLRRRLAEVRAIKRQRHQRGPEKVIDIHVHTQSSKRRHTPVVTKETES